MKQIISLLVAFYGTITVMYAQNQIATLSHNGEISTFYGAEALKSAHDKAENGDVITLSSGSFNATDISKLITIRGAGMGIKTDDNTVYSDPTVLIGNFSVTADGNATNHFVLEGIRHSNRMTLRGTNHTQFVKCSFYDVNYEANHGSLQNCTFIHCYVSNSFQSLYNVTFTGISSYFKNKASFSGNSSLFTLTNCVIETIDSYFDAASLKNCIIIYTGTNTNVYIHHSNVYNTLWVGARAEKENPFPYTGVEQGNAVFPDGEQLFEDGSFCKLTDIAKRYKGTDGTELGIYGGNLPFDPIPSNPQITKFNVASKTTADGKLSVDIEVVQP